MAQFAEDVAGVFGPFMPDETHDCLRLDLADLGADETYRQLAQAEKMLRGYMSAVEDINLPLYTALGAAHTLIEEAQKPNPVSTR